VAAPPLVLSIAGYDPSSGAGITADVKTAAAHGCFAVTCITALTVQSTLGVRRVEPLTAATVRQILDELASDMDFGAVRIGMLGSTAVTAAVADFLESGQPPNIILDPVLTSSSGATLLETDALEIFRRRLMPLADVITPNLEEAATLSGVDCQELEGMRRAAEVLAAVGPRAVVVTGGHLESPIDLLWYGGLERQFPGPKLVSRSTHGTGCAFAMALACRMALGHTLTEAVGLAKQYVYDAIRSAPVIGRGRGPLNHFPAPGGTQ
jgi:hydroxymethylpyrimidine/phosphomethylpyrimidine kinase